MPSQATHEASNSRGLGVLLFLVALSVGFVGARRWVAEEPVSTRSLVAEPNVRMEVRLRGDEPQRGATDAEVTVVMFSDYECPFCAESIGPLVSVLDRFGTRARLVLKHYPLPSHPRASPAARLAWAAHQQDMFWPAHQVLLEAHADLGAVEPQLADLGLDMVALVRDARSSAAVTAVDDDFQTGAALHVTGTPTFFVNGRRIVGHQTEADWLRILSRELHPS